MEIYNTNPLQTSNASQHILMIRTDILNRFSDLHFVQTAKAFRKYGHRVSIVSSSKNPEVYHKDLTNYPVTYKASWIPRHFYGKFKYLLYIIRSIALAISCVFFPMMPKPTVIYSTISFLALPILYLFGYNVIIHLQNPYELLQYGNHKFDNIPFIKRVMKSLASEILVSDISSKKIIMKIFKNKEIKLTFPFVDVELTKIKDAINIRSICPKIISHGFVFICFGEYSCEYNFPLVLQAFMELLKETKWKTQNRIHLVIAAQLFDTEQHQAFYTYLQNIATLHNCSHFITLLKEINPPLKRSLMYEATAVIYANQGKIFDPTLLEAMFLGKAVIAIQKGFAKDILTNKVTGYLIPPDAKNLASTMKNVINNKILRFYVGHLAQIEFKYKYSFSQYANYINNVITKHCINFCCLRHCCKHTNKNPVFVP